MSSHVVISGFVQGVGFRQFIKENAKRLGLTGWVKNTSANTVEAVFQGSKENIDEIILVCRKGPFLAAVKKVEVLWEETKDAYDLFEILA